MSKVIVPVNPFSSGPGGSRFELLVATYYLTSMLKGEIPLGCENGGLIVSVKLQQRNKDNPVDDVVIQTQKGLLSIQVKHSVRFTNNKPKINGKSSELYDALSQCWSLYKSEGFNHYIDCFGIAFNEAGVPIDTRSDLNYTINWAKTEISVESYLMQLNKFKEKKKYFDIFQDLLSDISESVVDDETTWDFIRHFVILPFDFGQVSSHSNNELLNKLLDISKSRSYDNAKNLFSSIYCLATDYAINGGELDCYSLEKQLSANAYLPINTLSSYVLQKNLGTQLKQKIDREIKSKKYIPEIFTEVQYANEELRVFSDPVLFIKKILEDLQRIDIYLYNELATKLDFPLIKVELPSNFKIPYTVSDTIEASKILKEFVSEIVTDLKNIEPYHGKDIIKYVNTLNRSLFDEIKYPLWGCNNYLQREFERIDRCIDLMKSQVLIIEGKAASGKTNFICSFADKTLKTRGQTTFYITGYDLSNEAITTALKSFIINRFNEEYEGKKSLLIPDIEKICLKDNKPLLIIIDGINEHSDLSHFAGQLEQIIEELTSSIYVKFILTCRSENFKERFSNLKVASFADKVSVIENFTNNIAPIHKNYMISAYFRFFKIKCHPSKEVIDTFVENPLILRLFCEGYGSESGEKDVIIGELNNIHLDVLFNRYNRRISDHFEKKYPNTNFKKKYIKLLNELSGYMINNKTFSNVPISLISSDFDVIITILVNEGVILRKDLTDSITEDSEVLNFTYDAFRDYILADYLIKKVSRYNLDRFKELFDTLVTPDCAVAEGLSHYAFIISRRDNNLTVQDYLKTLDNYDKIFLRAIFTIDDSSISSDDIETIKRIFLKDSQTVGLIYSSLINRRDKTTFPNLNIWLFVNLAAQLNKSDYLRLISPIFSFNYYWFENACNGIKKITDKCTTETIELDSNSSLIEMLICISPISQIPSRYYRSYLGTSSFELLLEIANKHPKLTISLVKKYLENPDSYISQTMWAEIAFTQPNIFSKDDIYNLALKIRDSGSISLTSDLSQSIDFFVSNREEIGEDRND